MKTAKIKYQEKISLWQEREATVCVPDDFDLKSHENLREAIEQYATANEDLETFWDTEDVLDYDFSQVEVEEEQAEVKPYKTIRDILEAHGFNVEKEGDEFFISQYTPAGEDWGFYVDKLEDVKEYAENYDWKEDFEMWMEIKLHDRREDIPDTEDLMKDQKWKEHVFKEVLIDINNIEA